MLFANNMQIILFQLFMMQLIKHKKIITLIKHYNINNINVIYYNFN